MKKLTSCLLAVALTVTILGSDPCTNDWEEEYANDEPDPRQYFVPQWSPDGSYIVFGTGESIYSVSAGGTDLTLVTASSGLYDIDFSPDGTRIVYTTNPTTESTGSVRDWEIEHSLIDGTDRHRLTKDHAEDRNPSWSGDGSRIAWFSDGALHVMDSDGSNAQKITPSLNASVLPPQWSPDGESIAFIITERLETASSPRDRLEFRYYLYVARADGSSLVNFSESLNATPSWSPDGRFIAFGSPVGPGQSALFTLDWDNHAIRELIRFPPHESTEISNISWSPDGAWILFSHRGLSAVSIDGSVLIRPGVGSPASWSPDGTRIAYGFLISMAADGTDKRILVLRDPSGRLEAGHGERDIQYSRAVLIHLDHSLLPNNDIDPSECEKRSSKILNLSQCKILIATAAALDANPSLNWDPDIPLHRWEGLDIRIIEREHYVVGIDLKGRALTGTIAPELGLLSTLETLDLSFNRLTGSIPETFAELESMRTLNLSYNLLTAGFRVPPGGLPTLEVAYLNNNDLSVPLSSEPGGLSSLTTLRLDYNDLTEVISPDPDSYTALTWLDLSYNELTGSIPKELANLPLVYRLDLSHNELTGTVPKELASMSKLKVLDLSYNSLSWPLPNEMLRSGAEVKFEGNPTQ